MKRTLRYGAAASVALEVADESLWADFSLPLVGTVQDPVAAVAAALSDPLGFPPLSHAIVPGDRVVVAIDSDVPQQAAVVAGVVPRLLEGNVLPEDVTILVPAEPPLPVDHGLTQLLDADVASAVRVAQHHPGRSKELAYLAASQENRPIYFNRLVFDADLVLPVSCLRPAAALGYAGVHGGLFPTFSDEATRGRFRTPGSVHSDVQQRRHGREAEEAAWLLGIHLMLQVVPARGDRLLHVLAGEAATIDRHGRPLCEAAWLHELSRRPQLVIAGIEGGCRAQTWENFGRALFAALSAVAEGGAVVLCTGLQCPPGPALQRLAGSSDDQTAHREIQRDHSPDALSASLLIEARRQRVQVYLLSGLDENAVEQLGIGYVSRPDQVAHLAQQYDSCILLADAHRAMFHEAAPLP